MLVKKIGITRFMKEFSEKWRFLIFRVQRSFEPKQLRYHAAYHRKAQILSFWNIYSNFMSLYQKRRYVHLKQEKQIKRKPFRSRSGYSHGKVNEPRPVIFCILSDEYQGTMQQKEGEDLSIGYMFKKIKFANSLFLPASLTLNLTLTLVTKS